MSSYIVNLDMFSRLQCALRDESLQDIDTLARHLRKFDISIPPNFASDEFESISVCVLQHLNLNYDAKTLDDLLCALPPEEARVFEVQLCHLKASYVRNHHSSGNMKEKISDIVNLANAHFRSAQSDSDCYRLNAHILPARADTLVDEDQFQPIFLWKCPEDGMFRTFAHYEISKQCQALVEDVHTEKYMLTHILNILNKTETDQVLQVSRDIMEVFIASQSLKDIFDIMYQNQNSSREYSHYTHPLAKLADMERNLPTTVANKMILQLKKDFLSCIEIALVNVVLKKKNELESEEESLAEENDRLACKLNQLDQDISVQSERCQILGDDLRRAEKRLEDIQESEMKARRELLMLEQNEAELCQLTTTREINAAEYNHSIEHQLDQIEHQQNNLKSSIKSFEKQHRIIDVERRETTERLVQLQQKNEWQRFLSAVSKHQPDASTLKLLLNEANSFARCTSLPQLVECITNVFHPENLCLAQQRNPQTICFC